MTGAAHFVIDNIVGVLISGPFWALVTLGFQHFKFRFIDVWTIRGVFGFTAEPTHVFLPLRFSSDGVGATSGFGDHLALSELIIMINRLHRQHSQITIHPAYADLRPFKDQNIIVLGGPKHSATYRELVTKLKPPFRFLLNEDACEISNEDRTIIFQPLTNADGKVTRDVGIALRAPNPFAPRKFVLIAAGCHSYGSAAAMRYLCDPKNGSEIRSDQKQGTMFVVECDVDHHRVGSVRRVSQITSW